MYRADGISIKHIVVNFGDFDDGCGDVCAGYGGYWVRFFDDLVDGGWTEVGYGSVVYGR